MPRCAGPKGSARRRTRPRRRCRPAFAGRFFYNGPTVPHPGRDRLVVTFFREALGSLWAPAELSHEPPDMAWVIGDPGEDLDHLGDPRECPQIGGIARRPSSTKQRSLELLQIRGGELRFAPRTPCPPQCRVLPPRRKSACHRLTLWRDTSSSRATSAWERPRANSFAAFFRRSSIASKSRRGRADDIRPVSHPHRRMSLYYARFIRYGSIRL